jgi:succinoglycan biosynthesis protein ExoO
VSAAQPDVSLIVAAWKAAPFLARAVASVREAQGVDVEIVIVDDASPDDTWAVMQRLAALDPRIVIDRLPANAGPSVARNRAIGLSRGRFVAVLDADDAMAPGRLARLVQLADRDGADIVLDNMLEVDADGRRIGDAAFLTSESFATPREITLRNWVRFNMPMMPGHCIGYLKPLIRRESLERLKVQYDPALRNSEDYYLIAHLLAGGARAAYTPEAGYLYTRAAGSTSHRLKPSETEAWLVAEADFLRAHRDRLGADVRRELVKRDRTLQNVNHLVASTDALKAKRVGAFLRLLVSDAAGAAFTLRTLGGVAVGRLIGRKPVRG